MITPRRIVAFYGNSLAVSSVAAGLQAAPEVELTRLGPTLADAIKHLDQLNPDVLVFDLAQIDPDHRMALLRKHPGLMMIGLDFTGDLAVVLSSRQLCALTVDDLRRVIRQQGTGAPVN